jgi:thymidylate kinase
LKTKLMEKPILDHPNFEKEFILITDASGEGLGAVLAQKNNEDKEYVIAYASRSLVGAEKNYPITELECLAIFWGVQHFHKFLANSRFTIVTDHAALKGLMNAKIPKGRRARWVMELQQYDFEVIHRSGKENKNADALSRLKFEEENIKSQENEPEYKIAKISENKNMNQKEKYVRKGNKWYKSNELKEKWDDLKYFTNKEAILLNISEKTEKELLKKLNRRNKPQVIIIDGVDGVGKSTVVENIIKELEEKDKLKVIFNKFKRRRNDDKRFEEPSKEYEWLFRKQVVEEINRRIVEYTDEDIIILDKSPYCEYFYQKTESFDRGLINPYGNHRMEKEIFKYKDIIDNAVVIYLENKECWNNYIGRETKKNDEGHKTSYNTLDEESYMDMVEMFKKHQNVYEDTERYKKMKIKNDNKSWKKVYKRIKNRLNIQND